MTKPMTEMSAEEAANYIMRLCGWAGIEAQPDLIHTVKAQRQQAAEAMKAKCLEIINSYSITDTLFYVREDIQALLSEDC